MELEIAHEKFPVEAAPDENRYEKLLETATRVYGRKRAGSTFAVTGWVAQKGSRIAIPLHLAEDLDLSTGDRIALAHLPNGNWAVARCNAGYQLHCVKKSKILQAVVSGVKLAVEAPAVASIRQGIAFFSPETFVEGE